MKKKEFKKLVKELKHSLDFIKRVQDVVEYWEKRVQELIYAKKFDYTSTFQGYNSKLTKLTERINGIEKRLKG